MNWPYVSTDPFDCMGSEKQVVSHAVMSNMCELCLIRIKGYSQHRHYETRVFAIKIPSKTALGLIKFSLKSLEFFGHFIVMIVLFLSKYEVYLCGCSSKL